MPKPKRPPPFPMLTEREMQRAVRSLLAGVAALFADLVMLKTPEGRPRSRMHQRAAAAAGSKMVAKLLPPRHPARLWYLQRARDID